MNNPLIPLATIASKATTTFRRKAKDGSQWLHLNLDVARIEEYPEVKAAITTLLQSKIGVRVLEGDALWYPRLDDDGSVIWDDRGACTTRKTATVKVAL